MDQAQNQLTEEFKKDLYHELVDAMIAGLEKGELFEEDSSASADVMLENIEKAANKNEIVFFLENLSKRWDVYRPVYIKYKSDELLGKVQGEINQLI